ncbi:alpha/beta hydrolase [Phytoactinopolyspora alkaliphila]|uniref:Alpha/beta hydrolase n=1 Tax=Phytoactinopolyspora alkaliphila TaxID=1783498 RepID=A0A6N9YGZ8_9ACTN|nr:alpha/beta hydrolase [Phytoactinopolyspora alkaliphila]NED94331.1 alpha/beta hydrolase [Phytoactinopolyspora alkaliphila]
MNTDHHSSDQERSRSTTAPERSGERIVRANGVDLCIETFGDRSDPVLLLIGGAASSMDWWEDEFCERIAARGRYVVRYDLRDTGRSVSYPAGAPGYTGQDLAGDVVGLLDVLGAPSAHLVGISMGAGIAQRIALEHPQRVSSLTLLSTSPGGTGGPDDPELPPPADHVRAMFAEPAPEPDWSDRDAVVESMVEELRAFGGTHPFDATRLHRLVGRIYDRTTNIAASQTNHWILEDGEPIRHRLREIDVPTLVMHGTADPLFPLSHGEALAREIPGARFLPLEGGGHEFPAVDVWDVVVPAILDHTAG